MKSYPRNQDVLWQKWEEEGGWGQWWWPWQGDAGQIGEKKTPQPQPQPQDPAGKWLLFYICVLKIRRRQSGLRRRTGSFSLKTRRWRFFHWVCSHFWSENTKLTLTSLSVSLFQIKEKIQNMKGMSNAMMKMLEEKKNWWKVCPILHWNVLWVKLIRKYFNSCWILDWLILSDSEKLVSNSQHCRLTICRYFFSLTNTKSESEANPNNNNLMMRQTCWSSEQQLQPL